MAEAPAAGLVLVDKPVGASSFAAISRLRPVYGRRLGHCGTLDPFASGLLVVLHGRATRLAGLLAGADKRYVATARFGATSTTDDPEGDIAVGDARTDADAIRAALPAFAGEIMQVPPAASAVHVDGERAYRRFRRGEAVTVPARRVNVHGFELMHFDAHTQTGEFDVRCGTGTYVRSLARDLGEALGCGAYLTALRRTEVGPFHVDDAVHPDAIAAAPAGRLAWLAPLAAAHGLPQRTLTPGEHEAVGHGRCVPGPIDGTVALVADGRLVAIGEPADDSIAPRIVVEPA